MSRRFSYIDRSGVYHRVEDDQGTPVRDRNDYFKGVAPSDLSRLDGKQLFMAAERLHESVVSGSGTAAERAGAQEALSAVYTERRRRTRTIR